jgi:iron-sulfur cluster repair protein YtfE (RIC family)
MNKSDLSEALEQRTALPDALRVLLQDYPREAWESNANFSALIRFWLDRHLRFRRMMGMMREETEQVLDRAIEARGYGARLGRIGSMFMGELHGHHSIEDAHYFPHLKVLDARIGRGFDILDLDHQAIDGHLAGFAEEANAVLARIGAGEAARDELGRFGEGLVRLEGFLNRHLVDEEELVVPVLLRYAPAGMV